MFRNSRRKMFVYTSTSSKFICDSFETLRQKAGLPMRGTMSAASAWIDVSCATNIELEQIGGHFALHPLTIEDLKEASGQGRSYNSLNCAIDRETCAKFDGYLQVVIQSKNSTDTLSPIIVVAFDNIILTFHSLDLDQHTNQMKLQLELREEPVTPDLVMLLLLQHILEYIVPFSRQLV